MVYRQLYRQDIKKITGKQKELSAASKCTFSILGMLSSTFTEQVRFVVNLDESG